MLWLAFWAVALIANTIRLTLAIVTDNTSDTIVYSVLVGAACYFLSTHIKEQFCD